MRVLIIEDEIPAARRLERLLTEIDPQISIIEVCPSVEASLDFLIKKEPIDLIFSDIQLSDGLSFDIFRQIVPPCPIIFTTAFDDYAIEAFKTHAVDYLLKPIDANALDKAIQKFKQYFAQNTPPQYLPSDLAQMMQLLAKTTAAPKTYRQRFLVVKGEEYISINATDIAYFYSENRITRIVRKDGKWFPIEPTLDDLEEELDPSIFFRINRQFITHLPSIHKVSKYFNGKLKIELLPKTSDEVTVSRDKAETFRQWLDF